MSIILGIIKNNKIYLSADTKLTKIDDPQEFIDGYNKLFTFGLDDNNYIFGTAGDAAECSVFVEILSKYPFSIPENYRQIAFMEEMQKILLNNGLKNVFLLFGCIENSKLTLYLINSVSMQSTQQEDSLVILPPAGTEQNIEQYSKDFFICNKDLRNNDILCYMEKFQQFVGDKSEYKYINDDFNHKVLSINGDVIEPEYSKKGYKVR